ncbi:GNAT family N-acetyltransferase [Vibrio sp. JC009]|uniref:GNAT family N-acetyltransferase n=1 Tax=Vibrio sp. JC009 TaxID=2912314 RepID=UPI0023B0BDF9|nr:GNAT family N-acetyltransferase [Vibrio sp. JC009]WED20556.1 GNAT family N-acetyltransferase [Vibrio sp. JC009]
MWRDLELNRLNIIADDIQIRFATTEDAKLVSHYFIKNREFLKPWEPDREDGFYTEEGWRKKLIKLNELHLMSLGFYCLIIEVGSGRMLGTISFSNIVRFPLHGCNVGYSLDENAQGRGIMRRALKLACNWMFEKQNMHRISASYMPRNLKSESVLRTVGFQQEGYAKDYLHINGQWEDHKLTALVNPGWQDKRK